LDPRGSSLSFAFIVLVLSAAIGVAAAGDAERPANVVWIQKLQGKALSFPVDVAVDRRGVAFLLDTGSRAIGLFNPKGEFLREIPGKGLLRNPCAIAVGTAGTFFIADGDTGRIVEMDLSGKMRREYNAGKNARITGVGVFGDSVYGVDNRNDRIVVFRKGGGTPESWGRKGERPGDFHSPYRLAIDGAGRVFVTDVLNARVQWFSAFGQHLGTMKRFGAGEGRFLRPTGISLDPRGRIWIGDSYTGLVQLFEERGGWIRAISSHGRPLIFGDPIGVASSPEGVWVADQKENRVGFFPFGTKK
jgi:streptogramin lyase